MNDLTTNIIRLIHPLKNKKFGVQLSGGLDSSLIIGILRNVGIEPVLIGLSNDRYEFRTERIIQEILLDGLSNNQLISDDGLSSILRVIEYPQTSFTQFIIYILQQRKQNGSIIC